MAAYLRSIFRSRDHSKSDDRKAPNSTKSHSRSSSETSSLRVHANYLGYLHSEPHHGLPVHPLHSRNGTPTSVHPNPGSSLRSTHDTNALYRTLTPDEHPSATQAYHRHTNHSSEYSSGTPVPLPSTQTLMEHTLSKTTLNPTNSSGSISTSNHPQVVHCIRRPVASRNSSSGSVATQSTTQEPKSALKHSGHSGSDPFKQSRHAHVSFQNPNQPSPIHMHPLLSHGRIHRAPISYNITLPPSSRTIVDRHTYSTIPTFTLTQPATEPPTYNQILLKVDKLPWEIVATTGRDSPIPRSVSQLSGKRFCIDPGSSNPSANPKAISILDVLGAIHITLSVRATQAEWDALGNGSRAQRKATQAYEKRCTENGGGWDSGVRRVDFLGGKTKLVGIEVVMEKVPGGTPMPTGKLVFSRP